MFDSVSTPLRSRPPSTVTSTLAFWTMSASSRTPSSVEADVTVRGDPSTVPFAIVAPASVAVPPRMIWGQLTTPPSKMT